MKKKDYLLLNKALYFYNSGILTFGDLHLGYEQMLKNQGVNFPFSQLEESKTNIKRILKELKKEKLEIKKIIILGDLKHHFNFQLEEKFKIRNFLKFLESCLKKTNKKNIILLKGNHEKIELDFRKYKNYYIQDDIAFIHGNKIFSEIIDKKIKTIVMGHLHPATYLTDKIGCIKKEKYKCFLIGKWKNKKIIILPSFFSLIEGTDIEQDKDYGKNKYKDFSIIPKKKLKKFNIFIVGKDKIYEFKKNLILT